MARRKGDGAFMTRRIFRIRSGKTGKWLLCGELSSDQTDLATLPRWVVERGDSSRFTTCGEAVEQFAQVEWVEDDEEAADSTARIVTLRLTAKAKGAR